jgi:hypothetical protein
MRIRTVLAAATLATVTVLGGAGVAAADDDGMATGTGQHATNGMADDPSQFDSAQDRPDTPGDAAQDRPDGRDDSAQDRPDAPGEAGPMS